MADAAAVGCWPGGQDLGLGNEVSVEELESPEAVEALVLVAFLYQALPQLIPRAAVVFQCKIAEAQVGRPCGGPAG